MSDKMTETWAQALYWDGGEPELWQQFKDNFVRAPEAARLNDLSLVKQWEAQEERPTRELAAIMTKRRELEDLHRLLKGAGR
jgi:hypothetical protein